MDYIRDVCKTCGKKLIKAKHTIEGDGDYCIDTDCYKKSSVWIEGEKEETRVCSRCGNEFLISKKTANTMCPLCRKKAMEKYEKYLATMFKEIKNGESE